jgi:small-conductance mechanosensitive channel
MDKSLILYLGATIGGGIIIYILIRLWIKRIENKRLDFVDNLKVFEAVNTEVPTRKTQKKQKEKVIQSIESRFTIIKRAFFIIFALIWIVLLSIPFIGKLSATFLSVLGTVLAVIIGIAARPFISNMIAGVVITFSRQLHAGDTVLIDNHYGTVEDITLSYTVVKLWNWKRYIIPNSRMLEKEVLSYKTKDSYIWTHIDFWVAYNTDLEKIEKIAIQVAKDSPHSIAGPEPEFWVMEMNKEGINCWIAAWTKSPSECWYLKADMRKKLVLAMEKEDIKPHFYHHRMDGKI